MSESGQHTKPLKWQTKLRRRELGFGHVIDEAFLAKLGVTNVKTVHKKLCSNGVETWGELLTLRSESEAVGITGCVESGRKVFGFLCRYKNREETLFPSREGTQLTEADEGSSAEGNTGKLPEGLNMSDSDKALTKADNTT